jgi:hypothetical protein
LSFNTFLTVIGANLDAKTDEDEKLLTWDLVIPQLLNIKSLIEKETETKIQSHASTSRLNNSILKCTNCNRNGHQIATCWRKGGGAEGKGPSQIRRTQQNFNRTRQAEQFQNDQPQWTRQNGQPQNDQPTSYFVARSNITTLKVSAVSNQDHWIIDSGTTNHLTSEMKWFTDYKEIPEVKVVVGGDGTLNAIGIGTIKFNYQYGDESRMATLKDVLYVPDLNNNLISCLKLNDQGITTVIKDHGCTILDEHDEIHATAKLIDNLFVIKALTVTNHNHPNWHHRLGHIGNEAITKTLEMNDIVTAKPINDTQICAECIQGKITRHPFRSKAQDDRETYPLHVEMKKSLQVKTMM